MTRRLTWVAVDGVTWRIEVIDRRWQLSRWLPITEQWLRVGDYSSKTAAIDASYEREGPGR